MGVPKVYVVGVGMTKVSIYKFSCLFRFASCRFLVQQRSALHYYDVAESTAGLIHDNCVMTEYYVAKSEGFFLWQNEDDQVL